MLDGGALCLPFLHRVDQINMRTQQFEIKRVGEKSLMTEDRIRIDTEFEVHLRVQPTAEGVATAAQAYGAKALRSEDLRTLLEGRFVDAIQAIAATHTLDALHEKRSSFARSVRDALQEEMGRNGLVLESVPLTRLDQAPFSALNENNVFNAVGMRRLAEIVSTNKKQRAQIEAEADIAVRQTHLEALKSKLKIETEQEQAQISQRLDLENTRAISEANIAKTREESQRQSEQARIDRERDVKAIEISRDLQIDKEKMDAMLSKEVRRVEHAMTLFKKQSEEASVAADTELSKAAVVLAQEKVQTDRDRAVQARSREIALARAKEASEVDAQRVASEAETVVVTAKAQAEASRLKGEGLKVELLAESEGKRAMLAAENTTSDALMRLKLEMYRLDKMPEITAQMMKPVEKIDSIRINQITGLGGYGGYGGNGGGQITGMVPGMSGNGQVANTGAGAGQVSAVNQAINSILDMALQFPVLKRIGDSIGVDLESNLSAVKAESAEQKPQP